MPPFPRRFLLTLTTLRRRLTSSSSSAPSSTPPPSQPNQELLDLLVCPLTKEPLRYDVAKHTLISEGINVSFPITPSGLPNLLPYEATILEEQDEEGEEGEDRK
jgi:uncharacterized protein YbaR (Trm112 family)